MTRTAWVAAAAALAMGMAAAAPARAAQKEPASGAGRQAPAGAPAPRAGEAAAAERTSDAAGPVRQVTAAQQDSVQGHNQVSGEIRSVDRERRVVTLEAGGRDEKLRLPENATVFLEGRLGSLDDLKEGQQVRAAWETRAGAKQIRWIEVQPKPSPRGRPGGGKGGAPGGGSDEPAGRPTADAGAGARPGTAGAPGEVTGRLVSADPGRGRLVVDEAGKEWSLQLRKDAAVVVEGRQATLADVREGMQVRAALEAGTPPVVRRLETVAPERPAAQPPPSERPVPSATPPRSEPSDR